VTALITVGTAIVVAIVAASAGYFFRRREHLRERRLDAYQTLLAAFLDAARSAADLLTVHTQVGWPHEMRTKNLTEEQRSVRAKAYGNTWERARADRRTFEVAAYGVELVASEDSRAGVEELRAFLEGAAYSGAPWKGGPDHIYPTAKLNPNEIEPAAIEVAAPFVRQAARELWGRSAPDAKAEPADDAEPPPDP
jgi:hypothetical protein